MSSDLIKGLASLRNEVTDLFKAKKDKSMENDAAAQWLAQQEAAVNAKKQPPTTPKLSKDEYKAKGHSDAEADVLTGNWKPKLKAQDNRGNLEDLTPAMIEHLKPFAAKHISEYDKMTNAKAAPEMNPVKASTGKLLTSADKAYSPLESAKKQFMDSDSYKGLTDDFDKEDAVNDFTSKWLSDPKNKSKVAGIHSLADVASEKHSNMAASLERRADQLKDIASGGPAISDMEPVKSSSSMWHNDNEDNQKDDIQSTYEEEMGDKNAMSGSGIQAASQHLGLSGKSEGEEGGMAQANAHQASKFASSNKEFVNEKVKPAIERTSAAAQAKRERWQKHLENKRPEAAERLNAIDAHKGTLSNRIKKPEGGE